MITQYITSSVSEDIATLRQYSQIYCISRVTIPWWVYKTWLNQLQGQLLTGMLTLWGSSHKISADEPTEQVLGPSCTPTRIMWAARYTGTLNDSRIYSELLSFWKSEEQTQHQKQINATVHAEQWVQPTIFNAHRSVPLCTSSLYHWNVSQCNTMSDKYWKGSSA